LTRNDTIDNYFGYPIAHYPKFIAHEVERQTAAFTYVEATLKPARSKPPSTRRDLLSREQINKIDLGQGT
jgi:hypothetical protein